MCASCVSSFLEPGHARNDIDNEPENTVNVWLRILPNTGGHAQFCFYEYLAFHIEHAFHAKRQAFLFSTFARKKLLDPDFELYLE